MHFTFIPIEKEASPMNILKEIIKAFALIKRVLYRCIIFHFHGEITIRAAERCKLMYTNESLTIKLMPNLRI